MIRRAAAAGDPWSGQMAFPGGRLERTDRHGFDAAVRETAEEIGADITAAPCLGRLSEQRTHFIGRRTLAVSPFVFHWRGGAEFIGNREVEEIVWVPLPFLMDSGNRELMVFRRGRFRVRLASCSYEGRRIWGLSLRMLDELISLLPA